MKKKVCLVLQRRFAYIGHAMALGLKKRYGISDFCAYVELFTSLDFLKSQNEIKYSDFILFEDLTHAYKNEVLDMNYINSLESELGLPNLWPFIDIDRMIRYGLHVREYPHESLIYTHEEMLLVLQAESKMIKAFLEKEKPDLLILSVVVDTSTMLLYHMAKKMGIQTLLLQTTRVEGRYTLTGEYGTLSYIIDTFHKIQKGELNLLDERSRAIKFLESFRSKPFAASWNDTPSARPIGRRKQFRFIRPDNLIKSIYWFFKTAFDYRKGVRNKYEEALKSPWYWFWDRFVRKLRVLRGFEDLYDTLNENEDFAFYPLQMEPEMSLSLFVPFFKDQLWLAKQIANSLPIHYKLYIKEHPAMVGYRPRSYYNELKKIPNVRIINPATESFGITQKSKIVFTPAGTAAWEAVLLGKPAITFGNVFFNELSSVKRCKTIEDLPKLVNKQLYNFLSNEKEVLDLLTAIYKDSVLLDLVTLWDIEGGSNMDKKKEAVIPLVDLIAEKMGLKKKYNL